MSTDVRFVEVQRGAQHEVLYRFDESSADEELELMILDGPTCL